MLTVIEAFAYSSELSLPLSFGYGVKLIEPISDVYLPAQELPADDLHFHELLVDDSAVGSVQQRANKKAPRPNKASRAFRHAQLAARQFVQQRRRRPDAAVAKRERLPLSVIELILAHLDIRGAAHGSEDDDTYAGVRAPERPCPASAGGLYDRLVCSQHAARRQRSSPIASWLLRSCDPAARSDAEFCIEWTELPELLGPVVEDMRACLSYIEAFQSRLDLKTDRCDYWVDMSHLRQCVFRLTGFWQRDTEHNHEAWAFGLPEDLSRLLYPQCGKLDHAEMSLNLDEVILGPAWDKVMKLEAITRLHQ